MTRSQLDNLIRQTEMDTDKYLDGVVKCIQAECIFNNLKLIQQAIINQREMTILYFKQNMETRRRLYEQAYRLIDKAVDEGNEQYSKIACEYLEQIEAIKSIDA